MTRHLLAPTIYPFASLQAALLQWQRGEERPAILDDNLLINPDDATGDGFILQDKYEEYVCLHSHILMPRVLSHRLAGSSKGFMTSMSMKQ